MLAASVVSFLCLAVLANARPQFGKPEDGGSFADSNVQKLARPSPPEVHTAQNNPGHMRGNVAQMMPPQAGMLDPRAQMAMMMQAAQFEQMQRQAAQNHNPVKGLTRSANVEPADNGKLPTMKAMLPSGAPPMQQPFGNGQPTTFGLPPMMPPVSGRNITEGHLPGGLSPSEIMMMQQQQMMMMNEYRRRQQEQENRGPSQEEMQQLMMAQAASREQFERRAMQQQQQAIMTQQASIRASGRQSPMNENTAVLQTAAGLQSPMGMSPLGMYPQVNDPRVQMQMEASQNIDPRLAMQMMLTQRGQKMSQDAASTQNPSVSESHDNQVPNKETISSFVQRVRDRNMMQNFMLQDQTQQVPAMLDPRLQQQVPAMLDPRLQQQVPAMLDPRRQQLHSMPGTDDEARINSIRTMERMAAMQDPRIRQLSMMQSLPMPGAMAPEPGMQDPRMQSMSMSTPMMQRPMLPNPTMHQSPLMPSAMLPTASPGDDRQPPTTTPLSGRDIASVTIPSIQHVMDLESRLLEARQDILRSFYTDLLKYRVLSEQVQLQLNSKLSMLHQIEAQLATPLRYILATETTTPRLNLPVLGLGSQSAIITRLRGSSQVDPTAMAEE